MKKIILCLLLSVACSFGQLTGNWSTDYTLDSTPADTDVYILQVSPYTAGTQRHTTWLDQKTAMWNNPTLVTPAVGAATGISMVLTGDLTAEDLLIEDSDASHYLTITTTSNLTAARTLTLVPGDASRTLTLTGNPTLADWFDQSVKVAASPTFVDLTATGLFKLPTTTSSVGQLQINGNRVLHSFGGDTNIFAGKNAGNFTLSGATNNTGIGDSAGNALTSADNSTFVGKDAGLLITTGGSNTAIGSLALDAETTGIRNTAVGEGALSTQTGTDDNVAVGFAAGNDITTGVRNTSVGTQSLALEKAGISNVALGYQALSAQNGGVNNIGIGSRTGNSVSTGDNNILIGFQAANNLTSGSNNLIIGHDIDAQSATASNQLVIGNLIFSEGIDGTGTGISTGNIGIGVVAPAARLSVAGTLHVGVDDTGHDVTFFGAAAGAFALWNESEDLLDLRGATAAGPGALKLSTGELSTVDGDILGRIDFQAPLDASGTDAILVAASIHAEADDTFASDNNDARLVFSTAASETATEQMTILGNGNVGINIALPTHTLEISGHLGVVRTATENDQHAIEIDADAAGFGDFKALDINYDTGAIATGEDEAVILVDINEFDANGGEIFGLEVLATDGGADAIYAMKAGAVVGPILQDSGVFANPTTGTNNTTSTDVAAMIDGSTGTNTTIFVAQNDYILIGAAAAFTEIEFNIETPAGNPGVSPTFGYSTTGSHTFTTFSPVDGTNGFTNPGVIAWDAADLTSHATNSDTGTFDIKITRTHASKGNVSIFFAKTAATVVFSWDKTGDVIVNSVTPGALGVKISGDGDGAITFLGLGDGDDEDLTLNLDDTANTGVYTSSTGLATINFSSIVLQESGVNVLNNDEIDASSELIAIMDDETGNGGTSGLLVFNDTPTLITPVLGAATGTSLVLTGPISGSDGAVTVANAATTFAVTSNFCTVTGDAGGDETIATITGGVTGMTVTLLFVDALFTITDTDAHTGDTVDLSAAFTAADDTTLTLIYNGTSWYEVGRSAN